MRAAVASVWAVIATVFVVQIANGLQTDILSLRAAMEFPVTTAGIIMSAYYVGYSAGPLLSHRVIERFGHVLVVVAATLIAGTAIVLHAYIVTPVAWALLRIVSGLVLAMLYVSLESWIHARVENRIRGRVFSIYMVAQMISMTLAQMLLSTGNPGNANLFLVCGVVLAVGGIPVFIARDNAPNRPPPEPFGIGKLYAVSPMGVIATVLSGVTWSIVFTFGPIYAQGAGLGIKGVSLFMGVAMVAAAVLQYPFGWVSDHIGRRQTVFVMCAGGALAAAFGWWADSAPLIYKLIGSAGVGAFTFPLYSVTVAHTNDRIAAEARVPAASGMVLLFGLGSIVGPLVSGFIVRANGATGYFAVLLAAMIATLAVAAATR
ncbi:MAG TPA: MFS transporter [Rhizomicrobium sp.]|jgi:MFS family permease